MYKAKKFIQLEIFLEMIFIKILKLCQQSTEIQESVLIFFHRCQIKKIKLKFILKIKSNNVSFIYYVKFK